MHADLNNLLIKFQKIYINGLYLLIRINNESKSGDVYVNQTHWGR
jgi:hypothetical protein